MMPFAGRLAGPALGQAAARLLDVLMPPQCASCKEPVATANRLCAACYTALPVLPQPLCRRCGIPMPARSGGAGVCLGCLADPPAYDSAVAPFAYDGVARTLVLRFKNGREELARLLGPFMLAAAPVPRESVVVPVPLHPVRLMARGYNQAALLARDVARRSGAPLLLEGLVRKRNTASSRGLTRAGRERNVRGAFAVAPAYRQSIRAWSVLLIDDVLTTGATAQACARVLKGAGAARVAVLTFARVADSAPALHGALSNSGERHGAR